MSRKSVCICSVAGWNSLLTRGVNQLPSSPVGKPRHQSGRVRLTSIADTLYIMAGLGLVERVDEDRFNANAITHHMVDMPSAQHGAVHLFVALLIFIPVEPSH